MITLDSLQMISTPYSTYSTSYSISTYCFLASTLPAPRYVATYTQQDAPYLAHTGIFLRHMTICLAKTKQGLNLITNFSQNI